MGVFLPSLTLPTVRSPQHGTLSTATRAPTGPEQANPLPTLIGVVVQSIVEVAILCAVGWYLAKRGIVDAKAKKVSEPQGRVLSSRGLTLLHPAPHRPSTRVSTPPATTRRVSQTNYSLSPVNTSLFTPCLLFNKVAFSLTPDKLAELYIIPIGFVLVSCFSAAVAYSLGKATGLKKGQRNFAS